MAVGASSSNLYTSARMRIVAADTVSFAHHGMGRGHVFVTPSASLVTGGSHRVWFMAAAAIAMFACLILCQDLCLFMARGAAERGRRRKRVRLVAIRTRIMPLSERRRCRNRRILFAVTLHAGCSFGSKLVTPMAVCARSAQACASVLDIHLLMALVTLTNRLFGGLVRIVATFAGHSRVHGKAFQPFALEWTMATRAMPPSEHFGLGAKNMARVAVHRRAIEVDVR